MRLDARQLVAFWDAASQPRPLVVIGAGRWGRTLLEVAAAARGSATDLALVARSNYDAACEWRSHNPRFANLPVTRGAAEGLQRLSPAPLRPIAIVATRPRDHFKDASYCLALKLDTLVEKPLVSSPHEAELLVRAAAGAGCALGLGVEFSLMPVIHYAAGELRAPAIEVHIDWQDPEGDTRNGEVKRVHEEVHVLDDTLPHAISILRVVAPDGQRMTVAAAAIDRRGHRGELTLATERLRLSLRADRAATARSRVLRITTEDGGRAVVDFSTPDGTLSIDGRPRTMPTEWSVMNSTLRLEIGAFFAHAADHAKATPLTQDLLEYARLQAAVRDALHELK